MSGSSLFDAVTLAWFAIGAITFVLLMFVSAPYGRHSRGGWGPEIGRTAGWIAMELPAALTLPVFWLACASNCSAMGVVFVLMWEIHYVQRTFVFPFLLRGGQERMPLGIPLMGIAFNLVNGCLQGGYLFRLAPEYGAGWLSDPRFISGALLFFAGLAINWRSDAILRSLRKSGEKGYQIPTGGLYRLVSCPNYLGEMIEWAGWAIATWSVSGLAFAFWTVCNLFPRALAHHRWYIGAFPDYPRERKAVIPYII